MTGRLGCFLGEHGIRFPAFCHGAPTVCETPANRGARCCARQHCCCALVLKQLCLLRSLAQSRALLCSRTAGVTVRVALWAGCKWQTSKVFLCGASLLLHLCAPLLPCCAAEQQPLE